MEATLELPENVDVKIDGRTVMVKGPKGENKRIIDNPALQISVDGKNVTLKSEKSTKREKKGMFTLRAHIRNMIKGSIDGHKYVLKICSSHFPMNVAVNGDNLVIKNFIGEKHPRTLAIKHGVDVKVEGDLINIESTSKELAGTTASDIEKLTKRPGYDLRIFQDGIYIINKDGKEIK